MDTQENQLYNALFDPTIGPPVRLWSFVSGVTMLTFFVIAIFTFHDNVVLQFAFVSIGALLLTALCSITSCITYCNEKDKELV